MKKLLFIMIMIGSLSFSKASGPTKGGTGGACNCFHQNCYNFVNETFCPITICVNQVMNCPEVGGGTMCPFFYCTSGLTGHNSQDVVCLMEPLGLVFGENCQSCTMVTQFTFTFNDQTWSLYPGTNEFFRQYVVGIYAGADNSYTDSNGETQVMHNSFSLENNTFNSIPCSGGYAGPFSLLVYKGADGFFHIMPRF